MYVTDSSPTDHRQIADRTPVVDWQSADRSLNRVSRQTVTNLLVFSQLTAGQQLADSRQTVNRQLVTNSWPTVCWGELFFTVTLITWPTHIMLESYC